MSVKTTTRYNENSTMEKTGADGRRKGNHGGDGEEGREGGGQVWEGYE